MARGPEASVSACLAMGQQATYTSLSHKKSVSCVWTLDRSKIYESWIVADEMCENYGPSSSALSPVAARLSLVNRRPAGRWLPGRFTIQPVLIHDTQFMITICTIDSTIAVDSQEFLRKNKRRLTPVWYLPRCLGLTLPLAYTLPAQIIALLPACCQQFYWPADTPSPRNVYIPQV
jgi:hypothetical protein